MNTLLKDYAFGIIPLRKIDDTWQVFVVQQMNGYWSFPKGHAQKNETAQQSAERELFEETGLIVKDYYPVDSLSVTYMSSNNFTTQFEKTVTLFCATVQGTIVLCPVEVIQGDWVDVDDLSKKIVFDSMQQLLKDLQEIVPTLPQLGKIL